MSVYASTLVHAHLSKSQIRDSGHLENHDFTNHDFTAFATARRIDRIGGAMNIVIENEV